MTNQEFTFPIPITRAYKKDGKLRIEGVASSTAVDSHLTIFNKNCQEGFAWDINNASNTDDPVTIEVEHLGSEEPINTIGVIVRAHVFEEAGETKLFIEAELDEKNPKAVYYFDLLTNPDSKKGRPKQLGFSINGYVKDAHFEYNQEVKKNIEVYDRVTLKRVGIVRAPSNPNTWVQKISRSVNWSIIKEKQIMENNTEVTRDEEVKPVEEVEAPVVTEVTETPTEEVAPKVDESTDEPKEEVTEDTQTEVTADEDKEENKDEENVERVNAWQASNLFEALSHLTLSMRYVENYAQESAWCSDKKDMEIAAARKALSTLNETVPGLLSLVAKEMTPESDENQEVRMDTTSGTSGVHQDVSDDIERNKETPKEDTVVRVQLDAEEVTNRLTTALTDFEEIVNRKIKELEDSLTEKLTASEEKVAELTRKLDEADKKNALLITRMEQIENDPVTSPGAQVLDAQLITRTRTPDQEKELKRSKGKALAKQRGDTQEMCKIIFNPDYIPNVSLD